MQVTLKEVKKYLKFSGEYTDIVLRPNSLVYKDKEGEIFYFVESTKDVFKLSKMYGHSKEISDEVLSKAFLHINDTYVGIKVVKTLSMNKDPIYVICMDQIIYNMEDFKKRIKYMEGILSTACNSLEEFVLEKIYDEEFTLNQLGNTMKQNVVLMSDIKNCLMSLECEEVNLDEKIISYFKEGIHYILMHPEDDIYALSIVILSSIPFDNPDENIIKMLRGIEGEFLFIKIAVEEIEGKCVFCLKMDQLIYNMAEFKRRIGDMEDILKEVLIIIGERMDEYKKKIKEENGVLN